MAPRLQASGLLLALLSLTTPLRADAAETGADDSSSNSPGLPFVINTWGGPFTAATDVAYLALAGSASTSSTAALDAVQAGCATCEANQCDGSVGYGGSPDEACETTLDALLMDGATLNTGAVAALRRVRDAVGVARAVLDHTAHSLLAGDQATAFAVQNGFVEEDIATDASRAACEAWREAACQPNYRVDVAPNATLACGPYVPLDSPSSSSSNGSSSSTEAAAEEEKRRRQAEVRYAGHDTISLMAITSSGAMAAGTSTNGASHKVPGRVGDGPIAGSGSYADGEAGACGATGDGDIMMRFLPCYQAVESLRRGLSPKAAAEDAVRRMLRRYPSVSAGIVVVDTAGNHGGAGSNWNFTYAFRGGAMNATTVVTVPPLQLDADEEAVVARARTQVVEEEPQLRYRKQLLLA